MMSEPVCTKFGETREGQDVYIYKLVNSSKVSISILNLGGIIQSIRVPDKHGRFEDITPGFETVKEYEENPPYFGAIIGRVANRIFDGRYTIHEETYQASLNRERVCLHGGVEGFDKKLWSSKVVENGVELHYKSVDNEESFPGNLDVTVVYTLTDDNVFTMTMRATTDKSTIINLTNHAYFNLASHKSSNIYDHEITVKASNYLPKNEFAVPTGEVASVKWTPFDLRNGTNLGHALHQVVEGSVVGLDHNLCLNDAYDLDEVVVTLRHLESGRVMEMQTNQPGVQIYTGNYLQNLKGKDGSVYNQHSSVALEAQLWPDAVHHTHFPSMQLDPGSGYLHITKLKFSVDQ